MCGRLFILQDRGGLTWPSLGQKQPSLEDSSSSSGNLTAGSLSILCLIGILRNYVPDPSSLIPWGPLELDDPVGHPTL